jgi:hypothetical protein
MKRLRLETLFQYVAFALALTAYGSPTKNVPGTLSLDIQGVREGTQANVVVVGPNSFQETLGLSQRLENYWRWQLSSVSCYF